MGLMDKLRDIFTEEVEVPEEPIKKEVIKVEISAPQVSDKVVEPVEKKEEKQAPIFFDDNDFASLESPKKDIILPKKSIGSREKPKRVEEKREEKKVFKPTPIISPVYGVLDKNYHKEDIKTKNNPSNIAYYNRKDVSIDDIRKKAYGTLEDDLEITLFGEPEEIKIDSNNEIDMFEELMDDKNVNVEDSDLFNLIDSMYEKGDDKNGNS